MARIQAQMKMPDFVCRTPFAPDAPLSEVLKRVEGKTALVFLRYYGCPVCQLDMQELGEEYGKIQKTGGQLLLVLQSDPEKLRAQITRETFPYEIVCDPNMELYKALSIDPAPSMLKMISLKAVGKILRSRKKGFTHGDYEGNEQQLPAAFVLTPDGTVTYAHYGKDVGDVPTAEELAALLTQ